MKPHGLTIVKIEPIQIGKILINRLEIDLMHVNYGLDSKTKEFNKKARSKFSVDEVVKIFQLLDGITLEPIAVHEKYSYFASDVYPFWLKKWFRLVFCIEHINSKTAGVITLYRLNRK